MEKIIDYKDFKYYLEEYCVRTVRGNLTSSIPKYKHYKSTSKKEKILHTWLFMNACEEAKRTGNNLVFNTLKRCVENTKNASKSDFDLAMYYLFDEEFKEI